MFSSLPVHPDRQNPSLFSAAGRSERELKPRRIYFHTPKTDGKSTAPEVVLTEMEMCLQQA